MSDRSKKAERQPGAALREFEETRDTSLDAAAEARERFVHGLMWAEREASGAAAEDRIAALLARLQEAAPAEPEAASGASTALRFWKRLAIAAAILAFLGLGLNGLMRPDEPEAMALVKKAIAETERGVHVYEARFMLYSESGAVQRERIWRIALAPQGRYHMTLRRKALSIQIASDGKKTWMLPPRGTPFLMPSPLPFEKFLSQLGPELSYYQLRPMLRRLLDTSNVSNSGYERDQNGARFAVLKGVFETREGKEGTLRLVAGVEDGRLAEFEAWTPHKKGRSCFQLTRSRIPEDLTAAGIGFEAPAKLIQEPSILLGMCISQAWEMRERGLQPAPTPSQERKKRR
ncbi:MAG: hypothetical protein CSA62_07840 [Planctomycetota bacterium]|nr:MAG: hypothetical protein CSA62_07840 [Planctomycetota bacterium]